MNFLRSFSPAGAWQDIRTYIVPRHRYQLGFMALAAAVTGIILWGFWHDSQAETPYKRDIIYVESWPLNRSDAEILEQQKIDMEKRRAREAELEAARRERQEEFKKVDDKLRSWGL